jgi:hypothetical protein
MRPCFRPDFTQFVVVVQVESRLREFATVRALEMKIAAAAAASGKGESAMAARMEEEAARSARMGESGNPCKLRLRIAQVVQKHLFLLSTPV